MEHGIKASKVYLLYLHSAIFDVLPVDFSETEAAEQREDLGSLTLEEAF